MLAHNPARLAAVGSAAATCVPLLIKTLFLLFPLLLAGCAARPAALVGSDPSESDARTPRVDYRSTVSGYTSQRPVGPSVWRKQNEQVAPIPKSGE